MLRQQGIRGTCRRHRAAYRARAARKMGVAQGGSGSSDGGHVHRSSLELGLLEPSSSLPTEPRRRPCSRPVWGGRLVDSLSHWNLFQRDRRLFIMVIVDKGHIWGGLS